MIKNLNSLICKYFSDTFENINYWDITWGERIEPEISSEDKVNNKA